MVKLKNMYFSIKLLMFSGPILDPFSVLVPRVWKIIFSIKTVKNGICLGAASKQNAFFSENVLPENVLCSLCLE